MSDLLDTDEAARLLNKPSATLTRWRFERVGPPWIKLGKSVRYRREDIDAYIMACRVEPEVVEVPHD